MELRKQVVSISSTLTKISPGPELYELSAAAGIPGLGHCITGRGGGTSLGKSATLNLTYNLHDSPDHVNENRARVFQELGLNNFDIYFQQQVHGCGIAEVPQDWPRTSPYSATEAVPETDAMFTLHRNVCLVAKAADCLLIGLFDPVFPAIAIIHAGWRSTFQGIAAKTVNAVRAKTGTAARHISALFSPSAGPCCYEVGPELVDEARKNAWIHESDFVPDHNTRPAKHGSGRYHLDLWSANTRHLTEAGLDHKNIYNPQLCTICNSDHFFSYRVLGQETGGHAMMVWLRGQPMVSSKVKSVDENW